MDQPPFNSHRLPQRRRIRLQGYNYSQAGMYFVTICTQDRRCLLGTVVEGTVRANEVAASVQAEWERLPERFPGLELDEWIIMPSHLHGILVLPPDGSMPPLGEIVRTFKAASTRLIRQRCLPTFAWQKSFYERIIRNEGELNAVREYIVQNPLRWTLEKDTPSM